MWYLEYEQYNGQIGQQTSEEVCLGLDVFDPSFLGRKKAIFRVLKKFRYNRLQPGSKYFRLVWRVEIEVAEGNRMEDFIHSLKKSLDVGI